MHKQFAVIIPIIFIIIVSGCAVQDQSLHTEEYETYRDELSESDTIEECKENSEKLARLGCYRSCTNVVPLGPPFCVQSGLFYSDEFSYCLSHLAIKEQDINICKDKELAEEACNIEVEIYDELMEQAEKDPSSNICHLRTDQKYGRINCSSMVLDECLMSFILLEFEQKGSLSKELEGTCFEMEFDMKRDECFHLMAMINKNESYCDDITIDSRSGTSRDRELCYSLFAFKNQDKELCNKMISYKDDCINALERFGSEGKEACIEGNDQSNYFLDTWFDRCQKNLAIFQRDESQCAEMNKFAKRECELMNS